MEEHYPGEKTMRFVGEFRVHDQYENEVNGLYVVEEDNLPDEFMIDREFVARSDLEKLMHNSKTTPHLAAAVELLTSSI